MVESIHPPLQAPIPANRSYFEGVSEPPKKKAKVLDNGHVQIRGDIFNLLIFTVIWHFLNIFFIICTMDLLF